MRKTYVVFRAKIAAIIIFSALAGSSCFDSKPKGYSIADSNGYEASLFRQHCAVCHGPEGNGKTIDDGTVVPSLRHGEFKFKTEAEIYKQISDGGNGMTPFRSQLSERELRLLADLVHNKLRTEK